MANNSLRVRADRGGEALLAARLDGSLTGIGGPTVDPAIPAVPSHAPLLCCKIGPPYRDRPRTSLARNLLTHARSLHRLVTVNAAVGSESF
jgi:hypothetical protein